MCGIKTPKLIDVGKLKQQEMREALNKRLNHIDFEGTWINFRDQLYTAVAEELGFRAKTI